MLIGVLRSVVVAAGVVLWSIHAFVALFVGEISLLWGCGASASISVGVERRSISRRIHVGVAVGSILVRGLHNDSLTASGAGVTATTTTTTQGFQTLEAHTHASDKRTDDPEHKQHRKHYTHDGDDFACLVVHTCVPRLERFSSGLDGVGTEVSSEKGLLVAEVGRRRYEHGNLKRKKQGLTALETKMNYHVF